MPQQLKTFQKFQNSDEYGAMVVPSDKLEEMKRRWVLVSPFLQFLSFQTCRLRPTSGPLG